MTKKQLFLWMFLFLSILHSQNNLQNYMTISVIDSISESNYNVSAYTGYCDVQLATNGTDIYLATKKMYRNNGHARADIFFGTRQGHGKWHFETVANCEVDTVYRHPINLIVHGASPVIFFIDHMPDDHDPWTTESYQLFFAKHTETGWDKTLLVEHSYHDGIQDYFQDGFNSSSSQDGVTAYWFRHVWDDYYNRYTWPTLMAANWNGQISELLQLPPEYFVHWKPVVTKDGEYLAFSVNVAHTDHSYWCIYVYRKSGDQYVRDFADSTISDAGWYDYLNAYYLAIGKKRNGDVMLVAQGTLGGHVYLKSGSNWTKIVDDIPMQNGAIPGASDYLPPDNERLFFSQDGSVFWGALDAYDAMFFYTFISFMTSDKQFGSFALPLPPGYPSDGIFQAHDFVITDDDTLHFVYEYQPPAGHPKYLVEGKVYAPDVVQVLLDIQEKTENHPLEFELAQNYPNPFNPTTTIEYYLPKSTFVRLMVYDVIGRELSELVNGFQMAGHHEVAFDASHLPNGIYIYRLEAGNVIKQRKMILLK